MELDETNSFENVSVPTEIGNKVVTCGEGDHSDVSCEEGVVVSVY